MARNVKEYLSRCETCKTTKAPNAQMKPPMGNKFVIERPWQRLYVDLLGPYPRSTSGKTMILVVLDHLTKFVWLKAINKGTTGNIISFLRDEIFLVYGVPELIHSDNGVQFCSKEYKSLLQDFGIQDSKTAVYSPQSNAAERVNRSILSAIRAYISKNRHTTWDKHLAEIGCALRNSFHEAVQFSPHFLVFGCHKINHGTDYKLLRKLGEVSEGEIPLPLPIKLSLVYDEVQKNLSNAYEKNARRYNLRTRTVEFNPGDTVYYRTHCQSDAQNKFCAKFDPRYIKATIHKRIGKVNYELKNEDNKIIGVYHAKDLRL